MYLKSTEEQLQHRGVQGTLLLATETESLSSRDRESLKAVPALPVQGVVQHLSSVRDSCFNFDLLSSILGPGH